MFYCCLHILHTFSVIPLLWVVGVKMHIVHYPTAIIHNIAIRNIGEWLAETATQSISSKPQNVLLTCGASYLAEDRDT